MKKIILLTTLSIGMAFPTYSQDLVQFREYLNLKKFSLLSDTTIILKRLVKKDTVIMKPLTLLMGDKIETVFISDTLKKGSEYYIKKTLTDTVQNKDFTDSKICNYVGKYRGCRGKLTIKEGDNTKDKLLVNFFSKKNKRSYYIKLEDREVTPIYYYTASFSGQVIPFKYRPSITTETDTIGSQMSSQFNASLSGGLNFGQTRYYYRNNEGIKSYKIGITVLGFFGTSLVTLKQNNTNISLNPITDDSEKTTAVLSGGFGFTINIRSFSFGGFIGRDWAFGDSKKQWNYHDRTWTGFGFGYTTSINAIANALSFAPK
jgi:hypothetical protein